MPSREFPQSHSLISPAPSSAPVHLHRYGSVAIPASSTFAAFSFLILLTFCFRKNFPKKRTVPSDSKLPQRFSYSELRRATDKFSPSRRLGQGGFGSVFQATLRNKQHVAVKVMESGSLQGEREFYNELYFASLLEPNDHVVSVLGFSSNPKRHRMLLVYELMSNGNLQDALLHKKLPELMEWGKRFSIAVDIAKGNAYLHSLKPPVIHGDMKPSNILLDQNFRAKIADFGLARLKSESDVEIKKAAALESNIGGAVEDCGSVVETESGNTIAPAFEDLSLGVDQSPEGLGKEKQVQSPEVLVKNPSVENVKVKEYVIEWIGTEIGNERPNSDWIRGDVTGSSSNVVGGKIDKKKSSKRLEWWISLDEDKEENVKNLKKERRRRPAREWWKEEYCEELAKKNKKKKRELGINSDEDCWPRDEELYRDRKKKSRNRSSSRGSKGSLDRWLEGFSGELNRARRNSYDSASGETPKSSSGVTSTPSMRGTVCYIAPEYGAGGDLSEKCDVYSFGVLLLVLIAGRRPLQVTGSPMSEFQRANLISWARHLARNGKLIELVDQAVVKSLDREQALLCITVALLCLQKSPVLRPSMEEVVGMLTGKLEAPKLPAEFSPSPPSRIPLKSRKKGPVSS